jgi:hypothetical protein
MDDPFAGAPGSASGLAVGWEPKASLESALSPPPRYPSPRCEFQLKLAIPAGYGSAN